MKSIALGIDVGGSHITAVAVDLENNKILTETNCRISLDTSLNALYILQKFDEIILKAIDKADKTRFAGIGLAFPGPLDYKNGIAAITGLYKYEQLYGVNIKQWILNTLNIAGFTSDVKFLNDAQCYLLGEKYCGAGKNAERIIGITLGTGFGSAFINENGLQTEGKGIPEGGFFYCLPHKKSIANDYFSTSGILNKYKILSGHEAKNVLQIATEAENGNKIALQTFYEFGTELGEFLVPFLKDFNAQTLIIGGNISKAAKWFENAMHTVFEKNNVNTTIKYSELLEDAALIGAAYLLKENTEKDSISVDPSNIEFLIGDNTVITGITDFINHIGKNQNTVIKSLKNINKKTLRNLVDAELAKINERCIWYETSVYSINKSDIEPDKNNKINIII